MSFTHQEPPIWRTHDAAYNDPHVIFELIRDKSLKPKTPCVPLETQDTPADGVKSANISALEQRLRAKGQIT